jgi:hypothetical protein
MTEEPVRKESTGIIGSYGGVYGMLLGTEIVAILTRTLWMEDERVVVRQRWTARRGRLKKSQ